MNDGLSDTELTRCAHAGDPAALGVLLQRHQAGMKAVALAAQGVEGGRDLLLAAMDLINPDHFHPV